MWSGEDIPEDHVSGAEDAYNHWDDVEYDDCAPHDEGELGSDGHEEAVPMDDMTNDDYHGHGTSFDHDTQCAECETDGSHLQHQDVEPDSEMPEGSTPCDPEGCPFTPPVRNEPDENEGSSGSYNSDEEEHHDGCHADIDIANSDMGGHNQTAHLNKDACGSDGQYKDEEDEPHEEEGAAPEQAPPNNNELSTRGQQLWQHGESERNEWTREFERECNSWEFGRCQFIGGDDDGSNHGTVYSEELDRYIPRHEDDVPQQLGDDTLINRTVPQESLPSLIATATAEPNTMNFYRPMEAVPAPTSASVPTVSTVNTVNFFGPANIQVLPAPASMVVPTPPPEPKFF